MTFSSTLSAKNQTTIPQGVVQALRAKPSSQLAYEVLDDGSVKLTSKTASFDSCLNLFPKKKPKKPVSIEAMNAAIENEAGQRHRRSAT